MKKVIDISWHKGLVDLQQIKDYGIDSVILKCTDGYFMPVDYTGDVWSGHTDPSFVDNWKSLKDLFEWRACYHFLRVDNEHGALTGRPDHMEQIEIFYGEVEEQGLFWDDIIILDIEQVFEDIEYLSKTTVAKRVQESIKYCHELFERKPLIYTGKWWWEQFHQYFDQDFIDEYFFWMSSYWPIDNSNDVKYSGYYYYIKDGRRFPQEWLDALEKRIGYASVPILTGKETIKNVLLWQYSDKGKIPGTNGKNIDLNYFITNLDDEVWNELRGEKPQDEEPEVPSEEPTPGEDTPSEENPPDETNENPIEQPNLPPSDEVCGVNDKSIIQYILGVLEALVRFLYGVLGK